METIDGEKKREKKEKNASCCFLFNPLVEKKFRKMRIQRGHRFVEMRGDVSVFLGVGDDGRDISTYRLYFYDHFRHPIDGLVFLVLIVFRNYQL